jgi:hypothetical protein
MVIKAVFSCNYAVGKRQEYIEWTKTIVPILIAPEELKKATAWTNWVGDSPHRVIEFEFEDMKACEKYFAREDVRKITREEWLDLTTNQEAKILELIYTPKE